MKPRVNNPGFVKAIQDVMDLIKAGAYPAHQINTDPGTGSMLSWWGDVGSSARTSDTSVVGDVVDFDINPGSDKVWNSKTNQWDQQANESPNNAYIGWGVYAMATVDGDAKKHKAAWSAAVHLGGKDLSL